MEIDRFQPLRSRTGALFLLGILAALPVRVEGLPQATGGTPQATACPDAQRLVRGSEGVAADIRYLADDALEGREAGTRGARCAADYLAEAFAEAGLEPAAPGGSYFQTFPIRIGSTLGTGNLLRVGATTYEAESDWIPFGFAAPGETTAPMIYGGHGISRPGDANDTYPHLDLEGKIVVLEDGDPRTHSGQSLYANPHFKATVAAGRGAAGVLVLLPEGANLPDLTFETRPSLGVPVAAVRGAAADALRSAARQGESATIRSDAAPREVQARNVAALLPGSDPELRDEVVILGAHYDHLGLGGQGSMSPDETGTVHNGADDNASGTAALLEVARSLASAPMRPARSVLFLAFTGEEKGLWGSAHYVREPLVPIDLTVAMLNMDMVGRLEEGGLMVFGVGTAEEWLDVLETANHASGAPLNIATSPDGFGPSDHSSFYGEGIPVLHFFTNTHEDYHRPSDDWQKIDEAGVERVAALVREVALELAGGSGAHDVTLTAVSGAGNPHGGPLPEGDRDSRVSSGYGPYLGTIPDMTPSDFGVRLTGVREGSPAQDAGLRKGDVIVLFAGKEITDLYAYTYALRDQKPGDEVEIEVERDGERVTLKAVLGERR